MTTLNPNFLNELLKACQSNKRVLETCVNCIQYEFLPDVHYKEVWQSTVDFFQEYKMPISYGVLQQQHASSLDTLKVINQVNEATVVGAEAIFGQLEVFVKNSMYIAGMKKSADLFNRNEPQQAFELAFKIAEDIQDFHIRDKYYENLLGHYNERALKRETYVEKGEVTRSKFYIDELDDITHGGCPKGDTACFMAQSGVGKSKVLKWIAFHNAIAGQKGLHIQAEGTHAECMSLYDALWTGKSVDDTEKGYITDAEKEIIAKARESLMQRQGELIVETFEKFNSKTMYDVRNIVQNVIKIHGPLDYIVLDYLEKVDPGDNVRYDGNDKGERARRIKLADLFKDICVEFNVAGFTATQASTVPPEALNDPKFVMTRFNISEVKALVNPFSFFFTLNQTLDEYKSNALRIYVDKLRKYRGKQTVKLAQAYAHEWFYDRAATIKKGFYQRRES